MSNTLSGLYEGFQSHPIYNKWKSQLAEHLKIVAYVDVGYDFSLLGVFFAEYFKASNPLFVCSKWNFDQYREAMELTDIPQATITNIERIEKCNQDYDFVFGGELRTLYGRRVDELIRISGKANRAILRFNSFRKKEIPRGFAQVVLRGTE